MIETVIGPVQAARPVIDEKTADGQASPGLSNVHYSPRAKVETFESAAGLMQRMAALQHDNQRVGVLDNHDDLPELAHNLFARLRQFDTQNVNVILCLLPPAEGLGVAIRDRLQRASGLAPDQPAK